MKLRYYQSAAIDALFDYWEKEAGNPLIDLATGAGKSLVMADIIIQLLQGWPDLRIAVITHSKELIEQNYLELKGMWPSAPAGIFSAGLRRADYRAKVLFGGIQTVWDKTDIIGHVDIVLVDECHAIPPDDEGTYNTFFIEMRKLNPELKIVGLTATPYRLGTGRLDQGETRLFDRIVYTYTIAQGVEDGYLTPLTCKKTDREINPKGVRKNAKGEYSEKAAGRAADEITQEAIAEIVERGVHRRSWMLFCSGKEHAYSCMDELRRHGIKAEAVTDSTSEKDRRDILAAFKAYEIQALTNNAVLTTGFNHKGVDLIAFLRLTMSVSLYLQMAGRGTRAIYPPDFNEHDPKHTAADRRAAIARGPKPNCLVLDFARLVETHGPVDSITVEEKSKGEGVAPTKVCPTDKKDENGQVGCGEKLHASVRECKHCGFKFNYDTGPKIDGVADDRPIMAGTIEPEWRNVVRRAFKLNQGKNGKKDTVMTHYYCDTSKTITDFMCPEHQGFMAKKASAYWTAHGGRLPVPLDCVEWIKRQNELCPTERISVKPGKGGYWDVKQAIPRDKHEADPKAGLFQLTTGKRKAKSRVIIDDEIPF